MYKNLKYQEILSEKKYNYDIYRVTHIKLSLVIEFYVILFYLYVIKAQKIVGERFLPKSLPFKIFALKVTIFPTFVYKINVRNSRLI